TTSSAIVSNLNSSFLEGNQASDFVLVSGSTMSGNLNLSYESLSFSGGSIINPDLTKNITYINIISGTGIATGTLGLGSSYGHWKTIVIENIIPGTSYQLNFPAGTLITPDGDSSEKTINFTTSGESIDLIYNFSQNRWSIKGSGFVFI
ncbi:MAG: hypothetical protein AABY22_36285, partial [Nanoarchaeota archaeon]